MAGKHNQIKNHLPYPIFPHKKLFIMLDTVHVFKNVAAALTNKRKLYINENIVKGYDLPSSEISIEPIDKIFQLDQ